MPTKDATLPTGEKGRLLYVQTDGAARNYFNAKRLGQIGGMVEELYQLKLPSLSSSWSRP